MALNGLAEGTSGYCARESGLKEQTKRVGGAEGEEAGLGFDLILGSGYWGGGERNDYRSEEKGGAQQAIWELKVHWPPGEHGLAGIGIMGEQRDGRGRVVCRAGVCGATTRCL